MTREKKDLPFVLRTDAFEERLESSFDVYARIARNVTTSLGRELTGEDEAILATAESSDFDAFDLYLLGVELLPEED